MRRAVTVRVAVVITGGLAASLLAVGPAHAATSVKEEGGSIVSVGPPGAALTDREAARLARSAQREADRLRRKAERDAKKALREAERALRKALRDIDI